MFKRFQKILSNAAEVLAPELPQLEQFINHWKTITGYFLESQDSKVPIEETPVSSHLHSMLGVLIEEEGEDNSEGTGPCMEYLLHNKLLDTLYTLGRADCPLGMKQKVLWFFTGLISKIRQPLLPHVNVYKPVYKLLRVCGEIKASPTETEEMRFLCIVCSKLKEDPYVVNFFLEEQKASSRGSKSEDFCVVSALLAMTQSADSRVVIKACEGLMLCCSLPEDSAARAVLASSKFLLEVVGWLISRYQCLPHGARPEDIRSVEAQWGMSAVSMQEKQQGFAGYHHVVSFVSLFDYCDQLIKYAHPLVSHALARAIRTNFLEKAVRPQLLASLDSPGKRTGVLAATAYLFKCFTATSTDLLLDEYSVFLCKDPHLQSTILSRCSCSDEEVATVNLQLYEALLRKPNLQVLSSLTLCYLLPPAPSPSDSGTDTPSLSADPRLKCLTNSSGLHSPPSLMASTSGSVNLDHVTPSSSDSLVTDLSSVSLSSKSDEKQGTHTASQCPASPELALTDSDPAGMLTADGDKDSKTGVTDGTTAVDDGNDSGCPTVDELGAIVEEEEDLDFEDLLSRIVKDAGEGATDIDDVVKYYLTLLSTSLQSQFQPGDCAYDVYLKDAYEQFADLSLVCSLWSWPTVAPPCRHGSGLSSASSEEPSKLPSVSLGCPAACQHQRAPAVPSLPNGLPSASPSDESLLTSAASVDGDSLWTADGAGPFLKMLLAKMANFVNQSYSLNLLLTAILSKLALYPQSDLHQYLLHPFLSEVESSPHYSAESGLTLPTVLKQVCEKLCERARDYTQVQEKLISRRTVLSEVYGQATRFNSAAEETFVDNVILMEEFLKELAAISFVKQPVVNFR